MKSRFRTLAILFCASMLLIAVSVRTDAAARTTRLTAARRQQALVKQINQRAVRFYRVFIRQSVNTTGLDCELNDLLKDLLLALDDLSNSRYSRHKLVFVIQLASDVEQELLLLDVSADVVLAWSRLHVDLDRLARMNGIKWSDTAITDELIARSGPD